MAKIGVSVFPNQDINEQLERIKALCGLSHIDIVMLEVRRKKELLSIIPELCCHDC